jgi:CubicO group peptidase (beta-lactamase class C family)
VILSAALLTLAWPVPPLSGQEPAQLDAAIVAARERLRIPGISVAVVIDGTIRYAKGFGQADLEQQVDVTPNTTFRTASLAKPLTATAVMQLAERGQLDLDAPIQKYCPAFPEKPWPVTARHLIGHLAGVRHYVRPGESSGTRHFFSIVESLALFKDDPLLHEPGTAYHYSTYGYSVLGCAIEGASKAPYAEYMQRHVLDPAGMSQTAVDDLYQIVPGRARGYQLLTEEGYKALPDAVRAIARPNHVYNAVLHDTSMKTPGGGWVSTPSDLGRFAAALLDGRLVAAETRERMWTSLATRDGRETGYGLGFGVRRSAGRLAVTHSGNQAGASSLMRISPERRAVLVIMTNLEDAPLDEVATAIAPLALSLGSR